MHITKMGYYEKKEHYRIKKVLWELHRVAEH